MRRRIRAAMLASVLVGLISCASASAAVGPADTTVGPPTSLPSTGSTSVKLSLGGTTVTQSTKTDVMLVLDESGSITTTGFSQLKGFAKNVVDGLATNGIFTNGGHVGVEMFSNSARTITGLSGSQTSVDDAITNISQQGGGTCIPCGLDSARAILHAGGAPKQIVLLITDGENNLNDGPTTLPQSVAALQSQGVERFTLGVGAAVDQAQLNTIASSPTSSHAFLASGFGALSSAVNQIVAAVSIPGAHSITVTATVAAGFTVGPLGTPSDGSASVSGNVITWTIPSLAAGTATLTYPVTHLAADGFGVRPVHTSIAFSDAEGDNPVFPLGSVTIVDATPPTVNCDAPPSGWHGSNVSVHCTASDGESGLANPSDASFDLTTHVAAGSEDANASTDQRAVCDNQGNCTTAGPLGPIKVDRRAPSTSCDSADGQWHKADVSIHCTASDGGSGLAQASDSAFDLHTSVPAGTSDSNASTDSHQVCDTVGNCATAGPVAGNKVDREAPTVTITAPGDGSAYDLEQAVSAGFSCQDEPGGSGIATCVGDVSNGHAIDTSSAGAHAFSVTATDVAGNVTTTTVHYTVRRAPTALAAAPLILKLQPGLFSVTLGQVSAKLTYGSPGRPAAGKTIVFTAGSTTLCTATTGMDGTATCTFNVSGLLRATLALGYTATFSGDAKLLPSTAHGSLAQILGIGIL